MRLWAKNWIVATCFLRMIISSRSKSGIPLEQASGSLARRRKVLQAWINSLRENNRFRVSSNRNLSKNRVRYRAIDSRRLSEKPTEQCPKLSCEWRASNKRLRFKCLRCAETWPTRISRNSSKTIQRGTNEDPPFSFRKTETTRNSLDRSMRNSRLACTSPSTTLKPSLNNSYANSAERSKPNSSKKPLRLRTLKSASHLQF